MNVSRRWTLRRSRRRPFLEVACLGAGPPVIAVPTTQGHWSWLAPMLESLADSFRVVTWSLRGERGHAVPALFDHADLLADLAEVKAVAEVGERAALVGTSFGGSVALLETLAAPERVPALVLVVTSAHLVDHARLVARLRTLAQRSPWLTGELFHLLAAWLCLKELRARPWGRLPRDLARIAGHALRHGSPPRTIARRLELFTALDVEARLHEVTCPTLVVSGDLELDRLVPRASQAALLHRIPAAEHAVVAGCGHLAPFLEPLATAAAMRGFLERAIGRVGGTGPPGAC